MQNIREKQKTEHKGNKKKKKQKLKKNKVKKENDAKIMGHTLNQQLETYNKNV